MDDEQAEPLEITPEGPKGVRFFARIRAMDLECPHCGWVYHFSAGARKTNDCWDWQLQRFHCARCDRTVSLGVIAWPLNRGKMRVPPDQVPSYDQARHLRDMVKSVRVKTILKPGKPANLVVEEEEE